MTPISINQLVERLLVVASEIKGGDSLVSVSVDVKRFKTSSGQVSFETDYRLYFNNLNTSVRAATPELAFQELEAIMRGEVKTAACPEVIVEAA